MLDEPDEEPPGETDEERRLRGRIAVAVEVAVAATRAAERTVFVIRRLSPRDGEDLLLVCAWCRRVYIIDHSEALESVCPMGFGPMYRGRCTHGICADCLARSI